LIKNGRADGDVDHEIQKDRVYPHASDPIFPPKPVTRESENLVASQITSYILETELEEGNRQRVSFTSLARERNAESKSRGHHDRRVFNHSSHRER
jgi:hypothetical protein